MLKKYTSATFISTTVLSTAIVIVFLISQRGEPDVVRTNLENIPFKIDEYKGTEDYFQESVYQELNADKHVYRHYQAPDGTQIDLYIGYYGTAKGGRTGHNPYACLPSAGWGIIDHGVTKISFGNKKVKVNRILAQKGNVYETVLHWYQSDKTKVLANGIQQNIQRFIGRIRYNRNDGAFVRITMLTEKEQVGAAREKVIKFAEKILLLLPNYWPEEGEHIKK